MVDKTVYGWENRVKFIVKFMYDIDNNGREEFFLLVNSTTALNGLHHNMGWS